MNDFVLVGVGVLITCAWFLVFSNAFGLYDRTGAAQRKWEARMYQRVSVARRFHAWSSARQPVPPEWLDG